jgi:methionyl aminopeptidase
LNETIEATGILKDLLREDELECYIRAGRIAAEVREAVRPRVTEGRPLLEIGEWVEDSIKTRGGTPAFPCNVCVNEVAAHYSPPIDDPSVIPEEALVKVDIGVHVDGYIADTATTVSLHERFSGMTDTINEALAQAVKAIRPGMKTSAIGGVIQSTIEARGYKPIWNLSGHQMYRYVLHSGKSIPNVKSLSFSKITEGEVFAVEPFLTFASGRGEVRNGIPEYIHRRHKERRVKDRDADRLMKRIRTAFRSLPFSKRWLTGMLPEERMAHAFNQLLRVRNITGYPVLLEAAGKPVAQAEHTVIVTEDGCRVTTA